MDMPENEGEKHLQNHKIKQLERLEAEHPRTFSDDEVLSLVTVSGLSLNYWLLSICIYGG